MTTVVKDMLKSYPADLGGVDREKLWVRVFLSDGAGVGVSVGVVFSLR